MHKLQNKDKGMKYTTLVLVVFFIICHLYIPPHFEEMTFYTHITVVPYFAGYYKGALQLNLCIYKQEMQVQHSIKLILRKIRASVDRDGAD